MKSPNSASLRDFQFLKLPKSRTSHPSNILVEVHDVLPVPKVIDFGVAKAMGQLLSNKTLYTGISQMVGTPLYMSPEQAGQSSIDIDTRSDVYSLGVLLYELLTGSTPFDSETLRKAGYDEMRRMIREVDPIRPSARISTLEAAALSTVSDRRQAEPKKLSQQLRGELDWIIMKALEKDRNRRYDSASNLAADIQRYLTGTAVQACPQSTVYRFRKFARKNSATLTTTVIVAIALITGTVVSVWQAVRATNALYLASQRLEAKQQAEQRARSETLRAEAEAQRANIEAERAKSEAAIAQAINDFVTEDILDQANPETEPDRDIRLKTVLDRAALKIGERFNNQPLVEASIRGTLGGAYYGLGDYAAAETQFTREHELMLATLGEDDPKTNDALSALGKLYREQGRYKEAEEFLDKALQISQRLRGDEDLDTLHAMDDLVLLYNEQGRHDEAEKLASMVLEIARRTHGQAHQSTITFMNNLAILYMNRERYAESEQLLESALEIMRREWSENESRETLVEMNNLAILYSDGSRTDKAISLLQEVVAIKSRIFGEKSSTTLTSIKNLASIFDKTNQHDKAESLYRQVLAAHQDNLNAEHPNTAGVMASLGETLLHQQNYREAESLLRQSIKAGKLNEPDLYTTFNRQSLLGAVLLGQSLDLRNTDPTAAEMKLLEAETFLLAGYEGMKAREDKIPATSKRRLTEALQRLVELYSVLGKPSEAARWQKKLEPRNAERPITPEP